jgi:succinate-acetate transporter protein
VPELSSRIYLRPLGTPITIGMSGLAIASLVEGGLELGWISADQTPFAGLILIAVPFMLQLLSSIFSYLARDGATGTTVGILAVTWLAVGVVQVTSPSTVSGALGLMLVTSGGLLVLSCMSVAVTKPLAAATFLATAARFVLVGIYQLGAGEGVRDAGGVIGLVVTGLAAYSVLAFELEDVAQRAVLPTLRRGRGRGAVSEKASDPVAGVTLEAGVRRVT